MKRLFMTMIILGLAHITSNAQSAEDPTQQFTKLKEGMIEATTIKQLRDASNQLDQFLSHIYIERSDSESHNMSPFLFCRYEDIPMTMPAILKHRTETDTIQFLNGKWYITKDLSPDIEIDLICFENNYESKNKQFHKIIGNMRKKYTYQIGEKMVGKKGSLFYVKDENLYYAAIESKKIPAFSILSNSEVINYASCLKAILKASNIEASYDEIIGQYMNTTIDERFVSTKNNNNTIANRKVITTFIPQTKVEATDIVNELIKERFMIAIDKDGNIGLLTAIALTGEKNYQPVHIRQRIPSMQKEKQRVQMSWSEFYNSIVALVKVDIY